MAISERDLFGSPFGVGDEVQVRGLVTAITSGATSGYGGSGDRVTVAIDVAGNPGEVVGATVIVSPVQCRRALGGISYGPSTVPANH
jgi:hypothetical protein